MLENNLSTSTIAFNTIPTQQNLSGVENAWNQQLLLMRQLPRIVNSIVVNLMEATKMVLTSMQLSLATSNRINIPNFERLHMLINGC